MLLNEFLKEHRKVEEQQERIGELNFRVAKQETLAAQQQKEFESKFATQEKNFMAQLAQQQKQIDQLTAGLEKASNQLEADKPALQTVLNNHR